MADEAKVEVKVVSKSRTKKILNSRAGKKTSNNISQWKEKRKKLAKKRFGIPGRTEFEKQEFTRKYAEKLLGGLGGANVGADSDFEKANGHLNVKRDDDGNVVDTVINPDATMKYARYETVPAGGTVGIEFEKK